MYTPGRRGREREREGGREREKKRERARARGGSSEGGRNLSSTFPENPARSPFIEITSIQSSISGAVADLLYCCSFGNVGSFALAAIEHHLIMSWTGWLELESDPGL